jgi:DnaJ-class molecular chaperone
MIICHHCKGNGYIKLSFEAETSVEQCKVCNSQGELDETKHYHQTWTEGAEDSVAIYYGPPLDPDCFKNYTISGE